MWSRCGPQTSDDGFTHTLALTPSLHPLNLCGVVSTNDRRWVVSLSFPHSLSLTLSRSLALFPPKCEHLFLNLGLPRYSRHPILPTSISVIDFRKFTFTTSKTDCDFVVYHKGFPLWEMQRAERVRFNQPPTPSPPCRFGKQSREHVLCRAS